MGFDLRGEQEALLWWKYVYWKRGISTREFRKEYVRDVRDVIEINNAMSEKGLREEKLRQMMSKVKF